MNRWTKRIASAAVVSTLTLAATMVAQAAHHEDDDSAKASFKNTGEKLTGSYASKNPNYEPCKVKFSAVETSSPAGVQLDLKDGLGDEESFVAGASLEGPGDSGFSDFKSWIAVFRLGLDGANDRDVVIDVSVGCNASFVVVP